MQQSSFILEDNIMNKCKYCLMDISNLAKYEKANHVRWCEKNPKRDDYSSNLKNVRLSIKNHSNQFIRAKQNNESCHVSEETKLKLKNAFSGKHHSDKTKKLISEKARLNPYKRKCKSAVYYNGFRFDSKWEVEVAKILDKNNIKWIQPKPLVWIDKNDKKHNYFADFYLIDYDIYLDPKNDYCIKVQKEKLDYLKNNYDNVHILDSDMIDEDYVLSILAL